MIDSQAVTPQVSIAAGFVYTPTERLADGSHAVAALARTSKPWVLQVGEGYARITATEDRRSRQPSYTLVRG
jgi:hypothetical protein